NLLRHQDGRTVRVKDIKAMAQWLDTRSSNHEIAYRPARVLMQDFTGVPAIVDLAAMREAVTKLGGDPKRINPLSPVDLVIDHSVMVDAYGQPTAFSRNVDLEYERNLERYAFLRWGQTAWTSKDVDGRTLAYPDTLVGTDSHTTMVNGLAVLGWGVGGIEAEAAML